MSQPGPDRSFPLRAFPKGAFPEAGSVQWPAQTAPQASRTTTTLAAIGFFTSAGQSVLDEGRR